VRPPTSDHAKVFISYSYDSYEHKDRVLDLSDRLRNDGIDSCIDQYEDSPSEGWPWWMINQIESANFVLVVCTENYERRFRGKEEMGKGLGVRWEGAIITQQIYDSEVHNTTFIPVLFSPNDLVYIPVILRSTTYYELYTDEGYETLYRRLTGQRYTQKPALGQIRPMPPRERKQSTSDTVLSTSHSTRENSFSGTEVETPQEGPARILKGFQEEQTATAAIHANPYNFVADIKDRQLFAGRRSEIAVIREELARLASANPTSPIVALVGERRVGKTSLLHRISEISAELNVFSCIIPITSLLARSAGEFWFEVFQRLLSSVTAAEAIIDEDIRPTESKREQAARPQAPSFSPVSVVCRQVATRRTQGPTYEYG
jgi:hypothetical protein